MSESSIHLDHSSRILRIGSRFGPRQIYVNMGSIEGFTAFSSVLVPTSEPFAHSRSFLPAATPQCHASNLLVLANGDVLCAWFGGTQEGKSDISIYAARLPAGHRQWTSPDKVSLDPTRSEQNPVLFQASPGQIWLLYTSQSAGDQDSAIVKKQVSNDDGQSWSPPAVLFPEAGTFIRQPIVVLKDGRWLIPIFKCRTEPGTRWVGNDDISCVRVSADRGATWTEHEIPNSFGCVHMEVQEAKDGSYVGLFRSRWADNIYISYSSDATSWSEPRATSLPNPNAGICFSVLPSGRLLAVYNHSSRSDAEGRREGLYDDIAEKDDTRGNQGAKHGGKEAFWGAPRAPLCLGWSNDRGRTWNHRVLEEGDGYCMTNNSEQKLNRELSYPSMAIGRHGVVHIAFTFWRQRIKYVQLDIATAESW